MSGFKEWAEKVEAFLEENQELADGPETSSDVLGRIIVQGEPIATELNEEIQVLTPEVVDAAGAREAAILDSSVSPKELQRLELVHKELKAEWDEINESFTRLVDFMNRVQLRYHALLDDSQPAPMIEIQSVDEIPQFKSEAEEAEFWSTHSLGERFLDDAEPIPEEELPRKESFLKRLFR